MTITRIISIGIVTMFALAIGIATFDPVYAELPLLQRPQRGLDRE